MFAFAALITLAITPASAVSSLYEQGSAAPQSPGRIAVANRADGTVSIIDASTDTVTTTLSLPPAANPDETMYCVFAPRARRLFVGDRGNDRVVAFDARTFDVLGEVTTGAGVFHMWMSADESQMWVVNDTDRVVTVFDPAKLLVLQTIPLPQDLVDDGGSPHDVAVEANGSSAFVSVFGLSDGTDLVLRYDLTTFAETGRIDMSGASTHLTTSRAGQLYACVQGSNAVDVFDTSTLDFVTSIPVANAHGLSFGFRERWLYATNISDGGADALFTIDASANALVDLDGVDAPTTVPHNVVATFNGRKLYVTHSDGTGTKVSVFRLAPPSAVPVFVRQVDVGTNPYGLCAVF